jgi:hypothetical protein
MNWCSEGANQEFKEVERIRRLLGKMQVRTKAGFPGVIRRFEIYKLCWKYLRYQAEKVPMKKYTKQALM